MDHPARIVSMWTGRHEAHLTIDGVSDGDLIRRLDDALERLLQAGVRHLAVNLYRLTGDDTDVLELLAATCHRLWAKRGVMEIRGLRHRLITNPEVTAFPEVFGTLHQA
jgi:anti-anti-sigma regulatory factor